MQAMKNQGVDKETAPLGRKFVSIQTLARRWNVSDSTVKRLIDEGELTGIKVRRSYKIRMDSVLEYESRSSF